mmetsp:Transcript_25811/g.32936  ORF Transcript_25811/g.32936 Transcript_25811/m.32936 type:complete len:227 (-) Transcript_25811:75-755(-)
MSGSGNHYYYFDVRARGFANRLLLEIGGIEYTDHRVQFQEWGGLKETLPLTFNQIPIWQDEEVGTLAQSDAIARYLARKFDLYGKSPKEAAQIDEAYELFNDLLKELIKTVFADDLNAKIQGTLDTTIPKYMNFAEKLLARNGTGWFVGDSLSLADVQAFHIINNWTRPFSPELITPPIQAFLKKMREVPAVKKYVTEKICATTTPNLPFAKYLNQPEQFKGEFDD